MQFLAWQQSWRGNIFLVLLELGMQATAMEGCMGRKAKRGLVQRLKEKLTSLYEGNSRAATRFAYGLLVADLVTVVYIIMSSFFDRENTVVDGILVLYLGLDYLARLWISEDRKKFFLDFFNLADLVALLSFAAPLVGIKLTYLRAVRMLRLMRSYRLQKKLAADFQFFRRHQDVVVNILNLTIFVFFMAEMVLAVSGTNDKIYTFFDALYFTVATLTTTGFGDIVLVGVEGQALAIIIMLFGVSLFIRLAQTLFRPSKVRFSCEKCGLYQHEADATFCKHCGEVLAIPKAGHR
jgi:voltage-gated potassium channel